MVCQWRSLLNLRRLVGILVTEYCGGSREGFASVKRFTPGRVKRGWTMRYTKEDDARFQRLLAEMAEHPDTQILKDIPQHKGNTTFAHCAGVAACAYRLAKKWNIEVDLPSLVRGAMLHDFYLYDTETMPYSDYRHSLVHPKLALENAEKRFALNPKERNVILSHMWPIPGAPLPRSREAWLVTLADKICATREIHAGRQAKKP